MNPYFLNIAFILSRRGTPFSSCSLSFSSWASRLLPSSILSSASLALVRPHFGYLPPFHFEQSRLPPGEATARFLVAVAL